MAWSLWDKTRSTLNRAEMIAADETKALRTHAEQMVAGLKKAFRSVDISHMPHIFHIRAPDCLERFWSLRLHGKQALEA